MYRIYINQAVLIISESVPAASTKAYRQVELEGLDFVHFCKHLIPKDSVSSYLILTNDVDRVFNTLTSSIKIIKAAGGLVKNEKGEYLFIFRRGKWDLPKGKVEIGEGVKEAAMREVEEECGIKVKQIDYKIGETYHVYEFHAELIVKQTTWYAMYAASEFVLVPQMEEDITEVRWFETAELDLVFQNTYPLIREVIGHVVH